MTLTLMSCLFLGAMFGQQPKLNCAIGHNDDMVESYMDYSDDSYMNLFTDGQETRMRTVLVAESRSDLGIFDYAVPVISGTSTWDIACPGEIVRYRFDITNPSPIVIDYDWSTTYGTITKYYYTYGKRTGIEVTGPFSKAKESSEFDSEVSPGSITISCTAIYPDFGNPTTTGTKNVVLVHKICDIASKSSKGSQIKGTSTLENKADIVNVSPNPIASGETFRLHLTKTHTARTPVQVNIYNASGRLIKRIKSQNTQITISTVGLKSGIYMVTYTSAFKNGSKRLVIE